MISLIIPTLNAECFMKSLLDDLMLQTIVPNEIIVVDSESTDKTVDICKNYSKVKVIPVLRKDFDHGKTRDMALKQSSGDIVIFMTHDAKPADENFIKNLVDYLENDNELAVVSGRQLAREDATYAEKLIREFNYPDKSNVRSKFDIPKYGIKTFYCTDVCAAYRKKLYFEIGGFDYPLKTNEDMFFAAKAIQKGYKVGYAADAKVIHSHNFTIKEQYKRNYIQGYEIEKHKNILGNVSANSEGMKMIKYVSKGLLKKAKFFSFIRFCFDCCARFLGSHNGKKSYQNFYIKIKKGSY